VLDLVLARDQQRQNLQVRGRLCSAHTFNRLRTAMPEVSEQSRNKLAIQLLAVTRADRTCGRVCVLHPHLGRPPPMRQQRGSGLERSSRSFANRSSKLVPVRFSNRPHERAGTLSRVSSDLQAYSFLAITVLLDVKDIPQVGPLQWGGSLKFDGQVIKAPVAGGKLCTLNLISGVGPSPFGVPNST